MLFELLLCAQHSLGRKHTAANETGVPAFVARTFSKGTDSQISGGDAGEEERLSKDVTSEPKWECCEGDQSWEDLVQSLPGGGRPRCKNGPFLGTERQLASLKPGAGRDRGGIGDQRDKAGALLSSCLWTTVKNSDAVSLWSWKISSWEWRWRRTWLRRSVTVRGITFTWNSGTLPADVGHREFCGVESYSALVRFSGATDEPLTGCLEQPPFI